MNRPNINATPVDYFDYFTTDQENNLNLIDKLVTETNLYAEQSIQQPISAHSRMNNWVPTDRSEMRVQDINNWSNFVTRVVFWRTSRSCLCIVVTMKKSQNIL
jgi:hypothetical protein